VRGESNFRIEIFEINVYGHRGELGKQLPELALLSVPILKSRIFICESLILYARGSEWVVDLALESVAKLFGQMYMN
jgi:hypothetical protein